MTYSGGIPSGSKNANDPLATGSFSSDPGQDVFPANVFPPATSSSDYSLYSSNGPTIVSNIFAHYNIPKSVDQLPFGFGEGIKTIRNRPSGSAHACSKNNKERKFQKKPSGGGSFTPEALVKSASDGWFNADGIGGSSTPANGADVVKWEVHGTTSGLSKLYNNTAGQQPHYVAAHTGWSSGATGNHPGMTNNGSGGTSSWLYADADGTWDKASTDNYTMAMVVSPTSQTSWLRAMMRWENTTGVTDTSYQDFLAALSDVSWDSSLDDKIQCRVRGSNHLNNHTYDPGTLPGTMRIVIRRDGSSSDLFYNSATAVSSPTVGSDSRNADRGIIYAVDGVLAEVLFLKYAASDSEIASLMSYWADKYGAP